MSGFYGCLCENEGQREYRLIQNGHFAWKTMKLEQVIYQGVNYRFTYSGKIKMCDSLSQEIKTYAGKCHNEKELLLSLFVSKMDLLQRILSKVSFLLIDDGERVFIHTSHVLYCARKSKGAIYLASNRNDLPFSNTISLTGSMLFYNNNLKQIT